VEAPLLRRRELGKGWIPARLINNAERLDPYGDDAHSQILRAVREARQLTALDEGGAWRHRRTGALAVTRVEAFAHLDHGGTHRLAWREHGSACLDALWQQRWSERDRRPGWIEARWVDDRDRVPPLGFAGVEEMAGEATVDPVVASAIDWIQVEDQTTTAETGRVACFEHLTIWVGRAVATITLRHDQADDLAPVAATAAVVAHARLAEFAEFAQSSR
jgi:hypothetical protein